MELVAVLESGLHGNAVGFPLKIDHIVKGLGVLVDIPHESHNSLGFMEFHMLRLRSPLVFIDNGKLRVQISGLMQTAFDVVPLESGYLENFRIRQERIFVPRFFVLPIFGSSPSSSFSTGLPRS